MPEVNDVLAGRYELLAEIASGGMATVWRARDQVLARTVAVKILHDHLASDDAFLERFRREAVAAAGLTHPHIVSIYDTGDMEADDSRCHYIVMEHCGGGTLAQLLRERGPLPSDEVATIGARICGALDYAHQRGIVHRDVKPANVLIGDDGLLKVGDFGIAKAASEKNDITTTGNIMGTVAYISPEYAADRDLDARSDVYSLGVVLYELATGKAPFLEETSLATAMRHMNEPVPPPRTRRAGVSRPLEAVVMKALEKDPDDRYPSATAMADALKTAGARDIEHHSAPTTGAVPVAAASTFRTESRWMGPVAGLIIGAIVLAGLATALFEDDPPVRRPGGGNGDAQTSTLRVSARDFDPPADGGDGTEDSTGLAEVTDGDPSTTWKTDIYATPLRDAKLGVGLLFDLGAPTEVTEIEVTTPDADLDIEILAGDSAPDSSKDLDRVDGRDGASGKVTFEVGHTARYWVVWITDLPGGGGGLGQIGEVRFFGP